MQKYYENMFNQDEMSKIINITGDNVSEKSYDKFGYGSALLGEDTLNFIDYDTIGERDIHGVLKVNVRKNGKLYQSFSEKDNHACVVAATRVGKTSCFVIPTIYSYAKCKNKKSMIITDPKGEIYGLTSQMLKREGYNVRLINFGDSTHSELWNPLLPIYDTYMKYVKEKDRIRANRYFDEVATLISDISYTLVKDGGTEDPYWTEAGRDVVKGVLWGMLEDTSLSISSARYMNRYKFNVGNLLSIMEQLEVGMDVKITFLKGRTNESMCTKLLKVISEGAERTSKCIQQVAIGSMSTYRDANLVSIMRDTSFSFDEFCDAEKPIAFFIAYKDESKAYGEVVGNLVKNIYMYLINNLRDKHLDKYERSVYFILDEFGNFPMVAGFDNIISACGGRNIWLLIVLQSYAQLDAIYGYDMAQIILDNLNLHYFLGSNNLATLRRFSDECGKFTRVSPLSALNGNEKFMRNFQLETKSIITESILKGLVHGECVVTEGGKNYTIRTRLEPYFLCKEYISKPECYYRDYVASINPHDAKYSLLGDVSELRKQEQEKKRRQEKLNEAKKNQGGFGPDAAYRAFKAQVRDSIMGISEILTSFDRNMLLSTNSYDAQIGYLRSIVANRTDESEIERINVVINFIEGVKKINLD